jgi:hypothetical protein
MPRSVLGFILVCLLTVLLHGQTDAKNQKRNFNLNCGLIGSFARHPQYIQGCKWETVCTFDHVCIRRLSIPNALAEVPLSAVETPANPAPGTEPNGGLGVSVGVEGSVSLGGVSSGGSANAGAGASSNGEAGGSAGGSVGAGGASGGGGLGIGGL